MKAETLTFWVGDYQIWRTVTWIAEDRQAVATGYWTVAINSDFCRGCAIVVVVVVVLLLLMMMMMMMMMMMIFLPLVPKPVSLKNKI